MRKDFTPLVYTVDGVAGREARTAEKHLAALLADKWKRQYSDGVLCEGEDATLSGSYSQSPHPRQQKSSGPLLAYTSRRCCHERLADLAGERLDGHTLIHVALILQQA